MKSTKLIVRHEAGLKARPAELFVSEAMAHTAAITLQQGEKSADARNIQQIVGLGVRKNDEIVITVNGSDESDALVALIELVERNFGEPTE